MVARPATSLSLTRLKISILEKGSSLFLKVKITKNKVL
jgi:hypothetical protein